jgi:hypothetical protein
MYYSRGYKRNIVTMMAALYTCTGSKKKMEDAQFIKNKLGT